MTQSSDEKYLQEYVGHLVKEVSSLMIHSHVFWEVQDIIKDNQNLHAGGSFLEWIHATYISDVIVRLRRLVDTTRGVRSFLKFLDALKSSEHIRTREYHLSLYKGYFVSDYAANKTFDSLAGEGEQCFSKKIIEKDKDDLKVKFEKINEYANYYVTHSVPSETVESAKFDPPTFDDVKECINFVEKLTMKYRLLVCAASGETLLPTWQYDWKKVFRVPWIV